MQQFYSGLQLYAVAKKKAEELGIPVQGVKMVELIRNIQEKEGNTCCFRNRAPCLETRCCWQLSCGAKMSGK